MNTPTSSHIPAAAMKKPDAGVAMRLAAAHLLIAAQQADSLRPFTLVHSHRHGAVGYTGWFDHEPDEAECGAVIEAAGNSYDSEFEAIQVNAMGTVPSSFAELTGADPAALAGIAQGDRSIQCLAPALAVDDGDPQPSWVRFQVDAGLVNRIRAAELIIRSGLASQVEVPVEGLWGDPDFNGNTSTSIAIAVEVLHNGQGSCFVTGFNFEDDVTGHLESNGKWNTQVLLDLWKGDASEVWLPAGDLATRHAREAYEQWRELQAEEEGSQQAPAMTG